MRPAPKAYPKPAAERRRLRILVTAGPTIEKIDPIRYISNRSTGTMGYEIAREAASRGHSVVLVSGPVNLQAPKGVKKIAVESALDMERAVLNGFRRCDALVMAAAVSDWRPARISKGKIKRQGMSLRLIRNPDILARASTRKGKTLVAGFALETEDLIENAKRKLDEKDLDFIVANMLSKEKAVFGDSRGDFLILDRYGGASSYFNFSKAELADRLIDKLEGMCYSKIL